MSRRIEVQCKTCNAKHTVKTLARSLLCCSTRDGVRRLIAGVYDPGTGEEYFVVTNTARVRVFTKEARAVAPEAGNG